MEHGDHRVELIAAQLDEYRVARHRPRDVIALIDELLDDRRNDFRILLAQDAPLPGVRVKSCHGEARLVEPQAFQRFQRHLKNAPQTCRRHTLGHVGKCAMGCHVGNPHRPVRQHHHRVALAGQVGEQFGMSLKQMPGHM